jgi:hypothetical protein
VSIQRQITAQAVVLCLFTVQSLTAATDHGGRQAGPDERRVVVLAQSMSAVGLFIAK